MARSIDVQAATHAQAGRRTNITCRTDTRTHPISAFSDAELAYLTEGNKLGRLATLGPDGTPHVVPLGWNYNPEHDTIDIGGHNFAATRKFRNVLANRAVGFVVDDVLPPWRPRAVQVRGTAQALESATWPDGGPREAIIRITPTRINSWGLEEQ